MTKPEAPNRASEGPGFSPLRALGVLLVVLLITAAAWVGWVYWGSTIAPARAVPGQLAELRERWAQEEDPAPIVGHLEPGSLHWIMRMPALGDDWEWPVAVGVDAQVIASHLGWYPDTSQPGQVGNFAVAGQCVTGAQPFRGLRSLQVGDEVIVEGADAVHTYTLVSAPGDLTVESDASWVLDPVPGQDAVEPTQALITLTTCEDLFPTPDRAVGFGVLTATEPR